ncbi:MAG TPA: putative glycoside hydrolase [Chloroflexota bacterium]
MHGHRVGLLALVLLASTVVAAACSGGNPLASATAGSSAAADGSSVAQPTAPATEAPPASPAATATPAVRVEGVVRDALTGQPVAGARVVAGQVAATTDARGGFHLTLDSLGGAVRVTAADYREATAAIQGATPLDVRLWPTVLRGRLINGRTGRPIPDGSLRLGDQRITTAADGTFEVKNPSDGGVLQVKTRGFRPLAVTIAPGWTGEIRLEPLVVRGIWLTRYAIASPEFRERWRRLLETTEINAVVINVKDDMGRILYPTSVPQARPLMEDTDVVVENFDEIMRWFKERNIYTIARIVTFKDRPLGQSRPDLAVLDIATGRPWLDLENSAWLDPFKEETWDYNIAIAVEAAKKGFDEIQFDYIRFPTDPGGGTSLDRLRVSQPGTMETRVRAITGFLARARQALEPYNVWIGADVFGYTSWRQDDMGIGQRIEDIAPHVDVLSPMLYPNLFWSGLAVDGQAYFTDNPAAYPYEIVNWSLKRVLERLAHTDIMVRPWLQYYDDYISGMRYGDREVRLQKQAAYDLGLRSWMFWDEFNRYDKGGFNQEIEAEAWAQPETPLPRPTPQPTAVADTAAPTTAPNDAPVREGDRQGQPTAQPPSGQEEPRPTAEVQPSPQPTVERQEQPRETPGAQATATSEVR